MSATTDRDELHRRILLLREKMDAGKFHVAEHLAEGFQADLTKIRIADDGLVDPDTVSSRIRAVLVFVAHMNYREKVKEAVSLKEIQESYIALVDSLFGELGDAQREAGTSPYQFASWFASVEEQVTRNDSLFVEFLDSVEDFWENLGEAAWIHAEDQHASRAVFGGEPFPSGDPAAGLGLYFDTVILPDPLLRMSQILRLETPKRRVRMIVRWALEVLRLRDLVLADLDPPFLLFVPDRTHIEDSYREFIQVSSEQDALLHLAKATGRSFETMEEANEFLSAAGTPPEVVALITDPSAILFGTDWEGSVEEQLQRHFETWMEPYGFELSLGQSLLSHFHSRMMQASDLLRRSTSLRGVPIIQAPTSWRWLEWQLEHRSHLHPEADKGRLHIAKALGTSEHPELVWIGDIPPDAMIEIRQEGALPELREQLGKGIVDLNQSPAADFESNAEVVVANLRAALAKHRENVTELRKKNLKFAGKELGSFLVTGAIEITAAASGTPLFGVLTALAGRSGLVPTLRDLMERSDELTEERKRIERSAIGILSQYVELPKS